MNRPAAKSELLSYEEWQDKAQCKSEDPEAFFHHDGQREASRRRQATKVATQICRRCIVAEDCFDYALRTEQPYGTWGGVGEDDRARMIRKRKAIASNHTSRPDELLA